MRVVNRNQTVYRFIFIIYLLKSESDKVQHAVQHAANKTHNKSKVYIKSIRRCVQPVRIKIDACNKTTTSCTACCTIFSFFKLLYNNQSRQTREINNGEV